MRTTHSPCIRTFAFVVAFVGTLPCTAAPDQPAVAPQALLKARLDAILAINPGAKGEVSAQVLDAETGQILYTNNASEAIIPASNMKVITMASAMDLLGADYKYQTVIAIRGRDLVIVGSGDPTLGDERMAVERGVSITAVLHEWAEAIKKAGIKQVPGNIVVDDSIFEQQFTHPHWPKNQFQAWYEAPVGGLNFAENCVKTMVSPTSAGKRAKVSMVPGNTYLKVDNKTVTDNKNGVYVNRQRDADTLMVRGSVAKAGLLEKVTVRDPGLYFGSVLKTILATDGIAVGGKVVREKVRLDNGRLPREVHIAHVHRSPLTDALKRCGKDSRGMFAEALFKTLGTLDGQVGSWDTGRSAVHTFLRKVGVPANQITIDDGSGLSRYNRLSANASTQVLRYMYKSSPAVFEAFRASLATPGTEGTLKKRLREPATRNRIFAKTGYINNVWTLAGFIHTESDQWLTFAIFFNGHGKMPSPKNKIDDACRLLVKWPNLPAPPSTRPSEKTANKG